jgi:hypothetical protein
MISPNGAIKPKDTETVWSSIRYAESHMHELTIITSHLQDYIRVHVRTQVPDRHETLEKSVDLSYPPCLTIHRPFPKAICAILGRRLINSLHGHILKIGSRFPQDGQILKD